MGDFSQLFTKQGENLSDIPHNYYPRPMLKRESFFCLNGQWDFAVTDGMPPESFNKKITVPFVPESLLSGINERNSENKTLWYKRSFALPNGFLKDRLIINFGAVDGETTVFLNGKRLGSHSGGYDSFSFDITDCIAEENVLLLSVTDVLSDNIMPHGKQKHNRGGMWYTPVSGIWQTVWLESVAENHIKNIKITTNISGAQIQFEGIESGEVELNGEVYKIENGCCRIAPKNPINWSPEEPHLYYFTASSGDDKVESYFALRELSIKNISGKNRMCLNGKPYFFHGILDQGYWSDGIFTPASKENFTEDIEFLKSLGFNMLRKHIKVEPQIFYHECDRLGMIVFQDMVNNGGYSFLRDTALPTIGFISKNDKKIHKDERTRAEFIKCMRKSVNTLFNHPSICCWTIFNEGWGQFCANEMYEKLREIDSSRFIDSASGWFRAQKTDLESRHIYFRKLRAGKSNKPYFISEFGGYSYAVPGHIFNPEKAYGYGKCKTREDFVKVFRGFYENEVIPLVGAGLNATVYTQFSDVEDEINGIITYDRRIQKVKGEEFADISEKLKNSIKKSGY